jgi:hypothetical protein
LKSRKGYKSDLNTIAQTVLKKKCDDDIMECLNDWNTTIPKMWNAIDPRTKKKYESHGRFFGTPFSFSRRIPEFAARFDAKAKTEYKRNMELANLQSQEKTLKRKKEFVVNWEELIRVRKLYRAAWLDTDTTRAHRMKMLRGWAISSLYTWTPPLRSDFGCVKLVNKAPTDKDDNYYHAATGKFYLNHFKTSKYFPDEGPIQFVDQLKDVLKLWIKESGNKNYLFQKVNGGAYAGCEIESKTADTFGSVVATVFNEYLRKKGPDGKYLPGKWNKSVGINVLRKSKATSVKNKSDKERQVVATLMRHSLTTANNSYLREDDGSDYEHDSDADSLEDEDF